MKRFTAIVLFPFLLHMAGAAGFTQLRSPSEFNRDGVYTENTYFVLYDANTAEYGWSSQWTQATARTYADKSAFFKWIFKDGTIAYTRQGEHIGDIGMITKYLLSDDGEKLADSDGNAVQPMTLENYPVKIELWMGTVGGSSDFRQDILVDSVCNNQETIQYGYAYYFYDCQIQAE